MVLTAVKLANGENPKRTLARGDVLNPHAQTTVTVCVLREHAIFAVNHYFTSLS